MFTFWWNRIVTGTTPRMTFCNAFQPQPKAFKQTVNFQSFHHVMRTSGLVAAVFWQKRRNAPLINANQQNQRKSDYFI